MIRPAFVRSLPVLLLAFCILPAGLRASAPALIEAESGTLSDGSEIIADAGASGGRAVRISEKKGLVSWSIDVPEAGRYELHARYRSARDIAQILTINGHDWGIGFVRTGDLWLECSRTLSLAKGSNHIEWRSDYGVLDLDSLRLSCDADGVPAPVYELPALSPRHALSYLTAPRTLAFKLDLNGHHVAECRLDDQVFKPDTRAFDAWPDSIRFLVPSELLAKLPIGEHRLECRMNDGSVAVALVKQEAKPMPAPFSILSVNVSHGKATLLCLPNSEVALIDTGTAEAARDILIPLLKRQGIHRIDHLIITHHHDDHDGGLEQVKANFEIGRYLDYKSVNSGDHLKIGGLEVLVLNAYDSGTDENSRSLALRWSYGAFSYSDGADNYASNQQACLKRFPEAIRSDVYYANHHFHGSVDVNFLRKIDAGLYLISAQEAVYARGAYIQQFKSEVEPHLRAAGGRLQDSLLSYEVGHVLVRVRTDGTWTYECHVSTPDVVIPALR